MSWTTARLATANDAARTGVTHIAWSTNGTSEAHAILPRMAITAAAATNANPSIVANATAGSGTATGSGIVTHWAFCTSSTGGAADLATTWNLLTTPITVSSGTAVSVAIGQVSERMHQTATAP